jgi:hypothetical protein
MPTLLVQSCSGSKNRTTGAVPALDLYDGYFFKIIHKARREMDALPVDIRILSAEHGLLHPETQIEPYDRRMTSERAAELREPVVDELAAIATDYTRVVIVGGAPYRMATEGIAEATETPVHYVRGDGIGEMGSKLKRFLHGDIDAVVDDTPEDTDSGSRCAGD